jgi:hypothetical protein
MEGKSSSKDLSHRDKAAGGGFGILGLHFDMALFEVNPLPIKAADF